MQRPCALALACLATAGLPGSLHAVGVRPAPGGWPAPAGYRPYSRGAAGTAAGARARPPVRRPPAGHNHLGHRAAPAGHRIPKERSGDIALKTAFKPGTQQFRITTSRNLDLTPCLLKIQMWIVGNIRADINRPARCVLTPEAHRLIRCRESCWLHPALPDPRMTLLPRVGREDHPGFDPP